MRAGWGEGGALLAALQPPCGKRNKKRFGPFGLKLEMTDSAVVKTQCGKEGVPVRPVKGVGYSGYLNRISLMITTLFSVDFRTSAIFYSDEVGGGLGAELSGVRTSFGDVTKPREPCSTPTSLKKKAVIN